MVFCGKCGAENPDGNGFFGKCGFKLEMSIQAETPDDALSDVTQPDASQEGVDIALDSGADAQALEVPKPEPRRSPISEPGGRSENGASGTGDGPRKGGNGKYAIVAVLVILIAAIGVGIYYMADDDGNTTYTSLDDLPSDHPLYGLVTPDGNYRYTGEATYQGQSIDVSLSYGIKDERYTSYGINGDYLTPSEVESLNRETESARGELSFTMDGPEKWNDGFETYDVYIVNFENGSVNYVASNGMVVRMSAEIEGMEMDLTLEGWSEGEYTAPKHSYVIVDPPEIIDRGYLPEGKLIPEPETPASTDGLFFYGWSPDNGKTYWDFDSDVIRSDVNLQAIWGTLYHLYVTDNSVSIVMNTPYFGYATKVDWGDGLWEAESDGHFRHIYSETGSYDVTVTIKYGDRDLESTSHVVIESMEQFKVDFYSDDVLYDTVYVDSGSYGLPMPEDPVGKGGDAFVAWVDPVTKEQWISSYRVTSDMALEASWTHVADIDIIGSVVEVTVDEQFRWFDADVSWGDSFSSHKPNSTIRHDYGGLFNGMITLTLSDDSETYMTTFDVSIAVASLD